MIRISSVLRSIRPKLKTLSSKISGVKQKFNEKFFLKGKVDCFKNILEKKKETKCYKNFSWFYYSYGWYNGYFN